MITRLAEGVRTLHPAYFALVMATGIVSIASALVGLPVVPRLLLAINLAAYLVLWVLTLVRLARHPREVLRDLGDHQRGVGFFTVVAGTSVLGSQLAIVGGVESVALAFWIVTVALWSLLTYAIFTALTVKEEKPTLDRGINGGWLVAVVATQSVSTLASTLAPSVAWSEGLLFAALCFWLAGGMLYIWLISLIFYRYTFFHFPPSDLMPPYWINMGAMAISTLAGTLLMANREYSTVLAVVYPFLLGFTIFFWATATWWIPMLVILGFWRHGYKKFPLTYSPLYWGAVFPLGMYTACTWRLAALVEIGFLESLARAFVFIALGAWLATFAGMVVSILRPARSS